MRSQFDDNGAGPDLSDVMNEVSRTFQRNMKRLGPILGVLIVVIVAFFSVFKVDPGERAIVRRFGKLHRVLGEGLHFRLPLLEQKDVVNVEQVRRAEVGVRGDERVPSEALMLTGDENIVEVQMIVQYRVAEPVKYLFRLRNAEETLQATAEVALRSVVGRTKIDEVITTGRERVQVEARQWLQNLMNAYQSGLEVTEVKLRAVDAPDEVKDAFHAVTRAREEKEKLINEAQGYRADKIPRARGEGQKQEREAEAYQEQRVLRAKGDAAAFLAVYKEYEKAADVTRRRLYLETMARILGRVDNKVLIDEAVAKGALPVLPIGPRAVGGLIGAGGQK